MRKAYLLAYSRRFASPEQLAQVLNDIPDILDWRREIPYAYFLISECTAHELAPQLRSRLGNRGRFLLTEITGDNKQGWLSRDGWRLLNDKKR